MKNPLSAVIITKNEEKRIATTIEALQCCDEIVVVDSGSTDKTVDICKQLGCRVYYHPFENYGKQKQHAVSLATNAWVLSIDADEVITPELSNEIQQLFLSGNVPFNGYKIKRSLVFMGKELRFGGEYNKSHLRLFNRQHGQYNSESLHESIEMDGKAGLLKNRMMHYSYESLHDYFSKFNQYTTLAAEQMAGRKPKSKLYISLKFPLTFLQMYLIRGLIFDGYNGFMWAMVSSFYPLIKYAKHRELSS